MGSSIDKIKMPIVSRESFSAKQSFNKALEKPKLFQEGLPQARGSEFVLDKNYTSISLQGTVASKQLLQLGIKIGLKDSFDKGVLFHQNCKIGDSVTIDSHASIGLNTVIERGAKIESFALIGNHVHICKDASIGYGAKIDDGVTIPPGIRIPQNAHVTTASTFVNGQFVPLPSSSPSSSSSFASPTVPALKPTKTRTASFNLANINLGWGSLYTQYYPAEDKGDEFYARLTTKLDYFLDNQETFDLDNTPKKLN